MTTASIVWLEVMVETSAFLACCLVNMQSYSPALTAL